MEMSENHLLDRLNEVTPIEKRGDIWLKRDDYFGSRGIGGAKLRAMLDICRCLPKGVPFVSAGTSGRPSPAAAALATYLTGIKCEIFVSAHKTPGIAIEIAESFEHVSVNHIRPGYLAVVRRAALNRSAKVGFDFERAHNGELAVQIAERQCQGLEDCPARRIIVPTGSGSTAAGIWLYCQKKCPEKDVIGVVCGSSKWAEATLARWGATPRLIAASKKSDIAIKGIRVHDLYEGRSIFAVQPGDLFWIVGSCPTSWH